MASHETDGGVEQGLEYSLADASSIHMHTYYHVCLTCSKIFKRTILYLIYNNTQNVCYCKRNNHLLDFCFETFQDFSLICILLKEMMDVVLTISRNPASVIGSIMFFCRKKYKIIIERQCQQEQHSVGKHHHLREDTIAFSMA